MATTDRLQGDENPRVIDFSIEKLTKPNSECDADNAIELQSHMLLGQEAAETSDVVAQEVAYEDGIQRLDRRNLSRL